MPLPEGFNPEFGTFKNIKPVINLPQNTSTYTPEINWSSSSYSRPSLWSRFNNFIAQIGNWFADHVDTAMTIACFLLIGGVVISAIACVISVWSDEGFFWALLAAVGCYMVGYFAIGLGWYVITIITNVLMYGLRLLFWNAWTLIISLCVIAAACIIPAYTSTPTPKYTSPKTVTQPTTPKTSTYRCVADVLNIRKQPNTHSEVLGVLRRGQRVEVYSVSNGFARISYNGQPGYVSTKYLELLIQRTTN